MSTENLNVESTVTEDLDAFSNEFFGQTRAPDPQEAATSEVEEIEDQPSEDDDATEITEEGSQEGDDTPSEDETEDDGEQAEEIADEPKPKKNRFQERIDELTTARREAERREIALRAEFEALKAKLEQPDESYEESEAIGPSPDDVNEDGTDKYPLGEFDPKFIKDQVKFTLEQEMKALEQARAQEEEQRVLEQQQQEIQKTWNDKLVPAQERYPDFQEKGQTLIDSFNGLDPSYGEYITNVIMSMDYGPDVFYYLSNNPDEAHKIVNSGAAKATIALGRLEAKFAFAEEEKQKARPIVSKAPTPPAHLNKGSAMARAEVAPDTDDLDAFEALYFKKGRR